jgi:hypothetical protein
LGAEPAPSPTPDQVKQNRDQLIHASVEAPAQTKPSVDLNAAVEKIQNLRVIPKPAKSTPETSPAASAPDEAEAAKPSAETLLKEFAARAEDPKADVANLVAQLKDVPADKVADPAGVADSLFRGGHFDEAYRFYEKASANKDASADTKAWTLLQMAHCRRVKDPVAAQALYRRVQTEHAASMWAATAALEERLIQWLQTMNPAEPASGPAKKGPSEGARSPAPK